ncbi:MAG: MFS transporter [Acidimicrobiia bacterium]
MDRAALRRAVLALGVGRGVGNASMRWLPLFLPTVARGFGASLGTTTAVMGIGELFGLVGLVVGPIIERWGTRRVLLVGLAVIAAGNAVAGGGAGLAGVGVAVFGVGYATLMVGESLCFLSGQTWIGANVPAEVRSHYLGGYESSWALSLLLGAPLAAAAVALWWAAPFWLWAALAAATGLALVRFAPADANRHRSPARRSGTRRPAAVGRTGWYLIGLAGSLMTGNIALVVVSGAWLERSHGFDTADLAVVAFVLGGAEFAASVVVGRAADRIGARRSVVIGLVLCVVSASAIALDAGPAALAVAALTVFVCGFEFSFITTLAVAVQRPAAEIARLMGTAAAAVTVARAASAATAGPLFERVGIGGVCTLTLGSLAVAAVLVRPATAGPAGAPLDRVGATSGTG